MFTIAYEQEQSRRSENNRCLTTTKQ